MPWSKKKHPSTRSTGYAEITLVGKHVLDTNLLSEWKAFMSSHSHRFLNDDNEYRIEYTQIHESFETLVQAQISDFLRTIHHDMESFTELIVTLNQSNTNNNINDDDSKVDDDEDEDERRQSQAFLELLLGVVDFRAFVDIMRDESKRSYFFQILSMWRRSLK